MHNGWCIMHDAATTQYAGASAGCVYPCLLLALLHLFARDDSVKLSETVI